MPINISGFLGRIVVWIGVVLSINTILFYKNGKISVTDNSIADVVPHTALDCYGVVDLVSRKFKDAVKEVFSKSRSSRGIKILTIGDRIHID